MTNFLGYAPSEVDLDSAKAVIIPVPYDATTSYKTGARYGPEAIIRASLQLEDYDLELDGDVSSQGIFTTPSLPVIVDGPKQMIDLVEIEVSKYIGKGKTIGVLGGEHSISLGVIKAFKETHSDFSVLYLDAHSDMRQSYQGSLFSHACTARRIKEHVPITLAGIRSVSLEEKNFIEQSSTPIFPWPHHSKSNSDWVNEILGTLKSDVYISIDLDVLDPSIMSAVGNPEPGGVSWLELMSLLRTVSKTRNIVGFDVVELSPGEGPESCSYLAAKLVYKLLGYVVL